MGQFDGILAPVILGIFGVVWFIMGFKWLKEKRTIEDVPTSKVRSLAMGLVEVKGKVVPKETLSSPLTSKKCVYYRFDVSEYKQQGKSASWVTIRSGTKGVPFFVKDDTGKVLVDPTNAEIDVPTRYEFTGGTFKAPPEIVQPFLKQNNIAYTGLLGMHKPLKFQEWYICPDEALYIMGTADKNPFVKSAVENEDSIMIQKGKNDPMFYISDKSEKDVLRAMGWKVFGAFVGGGLFILIGIGAVYIYFA